MRTIVFCDGQNLFHLAKNAWGDIPPYDWPSYDVMKLAQALVSRDPARTLAEIRFYTGVPGKASGSRWRAFWVAKLRWMRSQQINVYRGRVLSGQEEGVDVSLALDLVQATYESRYEVAIIISQDSDFVPAVRLAKRIARSQNRNLTFESDIPVGPGSKSTRGVDGTNWVQIDKTVYDACLDQTNHRPPP